MKNLLIVGAGGFGREVFSWLTHHPDYNDKWIIKGFLDDNLKCLEGFNYSVKVVETIENYKTSPEDIFILALGNPKVKEMMVEKLRKKNAYFFSYIHPSVVIGNNVKLGEGVIICPNVTITCDIKIGDFVTINANSTVGHDVVIGDYSTLSGHCDVTGNCELDRGVFMGTHAVLLPKTKVEDHAVIGAGSVGIRKVKANTTVFGVPGKKIN